MASIFNNLRMLMPIVAMLFPVFLLAQHSPGICGTEGGGLLQERLLKNKSAITSGILNSRSAADHFVPLKFHLIARDDGSGRIQEKDVFEQVCQLNQIYADLGMQFYLRDDGINYLDNTNAFTNPGGQGNILNAWKDLSAVNIYLVETATSGSGPGVTLAYYDPVWDWIVSRKDMVELLIPNVIPHEVGHYFSLLHPFNGWDQVPHDPAVHGQKVTMTVAPNGVTPVELVARTNCESSGDFICDTEADYNLGFGWDGCTPYNGGVRDRNNQLLQPLQENVMGYFFTCAFYEFSPTQEDLVIADYLSPHRSLIRDDAFNPSDGSISGIPGIVAPPNFSTTAFFDEVLIQWDAPAGATRYYLEVSTNTGFTEKVFHGFSADTEELVTGLEPNTVYYWRVKPLNDLNYCTPFSTNRSFTTGEASVAVNEISGLENWNVYPNPVSPGSSIVLKVELDERLNGQLQLTGIDGKIYRAEPIILDSGRSEKYIGLEGLSPGLYWLRILSDRGIASRKIILQ